MWITATDVQMVEDASFKILMEAPALVNRNPTFVIAALALALAHAAVLTDQKYEEIAELLKLHFDSAQKAQLMEETGGFVFGKLPGGEPS